MNCIDTITFPTTVADFTAFQEQEYPLGTNEKLLLPEAVDCINMAYRHGLGGKASGYPIDPATEITEAIKARILPAEPGEAIVHFLNCLYWWCNTAHAKGLEDSKRAGRRYEGRAP